jgi:hypothetical protein
MPPDHIRQLLQRRPFRPFRLYVLETTSYEVERPDWAILGKSVLVLYYPAVGQYPWRRRIVIALLHVSKLEETGVASPSGNGQAGQGAPA